MPAVLQRLLVWLTVAGLPAAWASTDESEHLVALGTSTGPEWAEYRYLFRPDRAYLITIDQSSADLVLTVEDPSATKTVFNAPLRRDGPEVVLIETVSEGIHTVRVSGSGTPVEPTVASAERRGSRLCRWEYG